MKPFPKEATWSTTVAGPGLRPGVQAGRRVRSQDGRGSLPSKALGLGVGSVCWGELTLQGDPPWVLTISA